MHHLFSITLSLIHSRTCLLPSAPPPPQDMWYATPLSEIDFSQCRKCTPSYRALPKSYPKPVCSERSEVEASLLNDVVCMYLCVCTCVCICVYLDGWKRVFKFVCMYVWTYFFMYVFVFVCVRTYVRSYICTIKRNAERLRGHSYINYNDTMPVTHFLFTPF